MKTLKQWIARIVGNWLTAFLSPLLGVGIAFNLPIDDINLKILISALISSCIVTGLVIARELDKYGSKKSS